MVLRARNPEHAHTPEAQGDAEVFAACRRGDDGACGELYKRFYPRAVQYVQGITKGRDGEIAAHDIAQDVLLNLISGDIREYDVSRGSNFATWFSRVVRNAYISAHRTARRRSTHEPVGGALAEREVPTPEALVVQKDLRGKMEEALQSLPKDQREALMLLEIDGLSYQEISARQNVPVGTVMSRISRAREKARNKFGPLYRELREAA